MPAHADFPEKISFAPNAVVDPLQPYVPSADKPWNARRVAHVYRRLGFGASLAQIQQGLQMSPSDLIDQLFDTAIDLGTPTRLSGRAIPRPTTTPILIRFIPTERKCASAG